MKAGKPYLAGVWILIGIAVFGIIQVAIFHYLIRAANNGQDTYAAIPRFYLFLIIFPLVEAFIYWRLRFQIPGKKWVRLHVWLLFVGIVVLPVIIFVAAVLVGLYYPRTNNSALYILFDKIYHWTFWFLFLAAHIFFIATIVKYYHNKKKEIKKNEAPAGLLDEFIS